MQYSRLQRGKFGGVLTGEANVHRQNHNHVIVIITQAPLFASLLGSNNTSHHHIISKKSGGVFCVDGGGGGIQCTLKKGRSNAAKARSPKDLGKKRTSIFLFDILLSLHRGSLAGFAFSHSLSRRKGRWTWKPKNEVFILTCVHTLEGWLAGLAINDKKVYDVSSSTVFWKQDSIWRILFSGKFKRGGTQICDGDEKRESAVLEWYHAMAIS